MRVFRGIAPGILDAWGSAWIDPPSNTLAAPLKAALWEERPGQEGTDGAQQPDDGRLDLL